MKPLRALVLGLVAYAAFLLATLPAAMVAPRIASATGGQATLSNATGTVWNGSARVDVRTREFSLSLDEVRWRFLPSRLAAGRIAFATQARLGDWKASAEIARSPMAWRIDDLAARGDASVLAAIFPLASAWRPAGVIAIEAPQLGWDGKNASGAATAEWRDASLALSDVRPLGSWRLQATADGPAAKLALATAKGPLRLSGNGTLAIPGRLAFAGEARADAGRERDLESVLGLLGPRRADGAHALEVR
jgi:general secretion pathway protein N